jgi:hypothetical protein
LNEFAPKETTYSRLPYSKISILLRLKDYKHYFLLLMNNMRSVGERPLMTLERQIFLQAAGVSVVVGLAVTGIWMAERVDKFAVRRFFQSLGGGGGSEKGRKGRSKPGQASGG